MEWKICIKLIKNINFNLWPQNILNQFNLIIKKYPNLWTKY